MTDVILRNTRTHMRVFFYFSFVGPPPSNPGFALSMGSPKQANAVLILGRAEARVAFMPQSGIRCDCVAERDTHHPTQ